MENQGIESKGVLGFTGKVLNEAGCAVVSLYDMGSGAAEKVLSTRKKAITAPSALSETAKGIFTWPSALSETVKGMFTWVPGVAKPTETGMIEEKIKEKEKKIEALYYEIGKKGAKGADTGEALESEPIKKLLSDVREYEKEIHRLEGRVGELEEEEKEKEKEKALRKEKLKETARLAIERVKTKDVQADQAVKAAIENAVKHGEFEIASERSTFDKIANDLLDSDMEVKLLAAAELGKMQNEAAVPVLVEALKFDDPYLTSEIINALINTGDSRAIPLFKEKVKAPHYRVRVACLRGLYKLAQEDDTDVMPLLTDALRDEHPDVRKTGATFIGWKDDANAAPGLVPCLKDEDERVRKAAVSALANIKDEVAVFPLISVLGDKNRQIRKKAFDAIQTIVGEQITFDLEASGKALSEAMDNLRAWWQEKRIGTGVEDRQAEEEEPEAAAAPEAEEPELTREKLMRMLKAELISLCKRGGIECDEKLTKAEIVELILTEKE